MAQTNVGGLYTKSVQYSYECPEIKVTIQLAMGVRNFLQDVYKDLCNQLDDNIYMSFDDNDYGNLARYAEEKIIQRPVYIKTYQEIFHCAEKKISCVSWHALISGIIAVAYVSNPLFLVKEESSEKIIRDPSEEKNFVLIWDYKNNVKPRLYLQGRAEITALSFCPYDNNILVAGYKNGQIAIWDLTENLHHLKIPKYRTPQQQNIHVMISQMTSWMKKYVEGKIHFPTIHSAVNVSHTSAVSSIAWFPPESYTIEEPRLKFVTSEMEGNVILIWDLHQTDDAESRLFRRNKAKSRPSALDRGKSKLERHHSRFLPICRMYLSSLSDRKCNPVQKLCMPNEFYTYKATNPETMEDLYAETIFQVTGLLYPLVKSEKILFTTGLGLLKIATCAGAKDVNVASLEICGMESFKTVHDGPILACETNIFFPNLILTVGGCVFAIWDCTKSNVALFWRKNKLRYLSGMWCLHRPLSMILIRSDRFFEYWDITESTKTPLQIFKYKGYEAINFYGTANRFHIRKNTFIATDRVGAFKVLFLPTETFDQEEYNIKEAEEFIERILSLNKNMEELTIKFKKLREEIVKVITEEEVIKQPSISVPIKKEEKEQEVVKPSRAAIFEEKLTEHGISVFLGLRGLDADKLEAVMQPLRDNFNSEDLIRKHLIRKESESAELIRFTKKHILKVFRKFYGSHVEIKPSITEERALEIKREFTEGYGNVQKEFIINLKRIQRLKSVDEEVMLLNWINAYRRKHRATTIGKSEVNIALKEMQHLTADLNALTCNTHRASIDITSSKSVSFG